jgi:hypothetical protein
MRAITAAGLAAVAIATAATASAAQAATPSVNIRHAVARVTIVPSDRADIQVVIKTPNAKLPLRVDRRGDRIIINGDLKWNKIRNCRGGFDNASVDVRNVGTVRWNDMPEVIIYTPRDVSVEAGGAVYGAIGRSQSVDLSNAGCGDWRLGNVAGKLDISQAGSGDVFAGSAGSLDLSVAGSGDTYVKTVGMTDISIAGSGDVDLGSVQGNMDVSIAGSGDVKVHSGKAGALDVAIAGSGDIRFRGEVRDVDLSIMGSGDVWVTTVTGSTSKSVMGSGTIHVGPFEMKRD